MGVLDRFYYIVNSMVPDWTAPFDKVCSHDKIKPEVQFNICSRCKENVLCTSYTMGCPPVREDNPQALADNPWYYYFIPPTSV